MRVLFFLQAIFAFFSITSALTTYTDYNDGGHILANVMRNSDGSIADCYLVGDINVVRLLINEDTDEVPEVMKNMSLPENITGPIEQITTDQMGEIVDTCTRIAKNGTHTIPLGKFGQAVYDVARYMFIVPGTKWCGAGNVAKNYDDLGPLEATDRCCRDHDNSQDNIKIGKSKHNLTNPLPYTMTRCMWDQKFATCLKNNSDISSAIIGSVFFNVLKTRCFELRHPSKCVKRVCLSETCVKYEEDTSKPEEWQLFDEPKFIPTDLFKKIPVNQVLSTLLYSLPGLGDVTDIKNRFNPQNWKKVTCSLL